MNGRLLAMNTVRSEGLLALCFFELARIHSYNLAIYLLQVVPNTAARGQRWLPKDEERIKWILQILLSPL